MQSWLDKDGMKHLGGTALHTAVDKQHEEVVEVLLEANADPDLLQKVITQSPYIMAVKYKDSTVANLLHDEVAREKEQDLSSLAQILNLLVFL